MGDWRDDAACLGADPKLFFPDSKYVEPKAEALCASCPVRIECLVFAIENKIEFGTWGGHGVNARKRIKRRGREVA